MDWQPIETAPRDKPILGWSDEGMAYVCWSIAKGHAWAFFDSPEVGRLSFHPTHWMPLPPTPDRSGNCEDAKKPDPWDSFSELEKDLMLARQGDYPGAEGCKRIAAAYDALTNTPDRSGEADETRSGSAEGESGLPEGSST